MQNAYHFMKLNNAEMKMTLTLYHLHFPIFSENI